MTTTTLEKLNNQLQRVNELNQKLESKLRELSTMPTSLEEKAERALTYYIIKAALERTKSTIELSMTAHTATVTVIK